ncbi:nucleoside monophosphate kinase [Micromonospora sp. NPDC005298]|uniref:adenylate kinase family protein n=1 Tax=Micromonospora sp. NPDC005298 TaxID=3156873 RepID=UPI0033AB850D
MGMRVVRLALFGPPGAETVEVAAHVADRLGLPMITIRDAVQSAVRAGSDFGSKVRRLFDNEEPLPTELISALVRGRVEEADATNGFVYAAEGHTRPMVPLLDFPQIRMVELVLTDAEAIRRLSGRRSCSQCGKSFRAEEASAAGGACNLCGGKLFRRDDDAPDVVNQQLSRYHESADSVVVYCRAHGRLVSIDASRSAPEIADELSDKLDTV